MNKWIEYFYYLLDVGKHTEQNVELEELKEVSNDEEITMQELLAAVKRLKLGKRHIVLN